MTTANLAPTDVVIVDSSPSTMRNLPSAATSKLVEPNCPGMCSTSKSCCGVPLSPGTVTSLGRYAAARSTMRVLALWVGAISLAVIAWTVVE